MQMNEFKIVNCTKHRLTLIFEDGTYMEIRPSGPYARVDERMEGETYVMIEGHKVRLRRAAYGEVVGLPEPKPGVLYVVSAIVRDRVLHRTDVVSPDTGLGVVRDADNRIQGTVGFLYA
jgi:hypothetical protein